MYLGKVPVRRLQKTPPKKMPASYDPQARQGRATHHLQNEKFPQANRQTECGSTPAMSQSLVFLGQNEKKQKSSQQTHSICSPQVLSLLNQCKFLEELVQKSKQIIQEKNEKIRCLLEVLEKRERTLKEFHYQNLKLKEERLILIEQITQLENQLNQEEDVHSQDGSYQPRMSDLTDLRHFFNQIRMQTDSMPVFIDQQDAIDVDNMTYEQLLQLEDHIGYVNRGLQKEHIKMLAKFSFSSLPEDQNETICSICQQDFQPIDKCRQLTCSHYYHAKCIKQWLIKEKHCPICKTEQVPPNHNHNV